jgi:hypothetical protein
MSQGSGTLNTAAERERKLGTVREHKKNFNFVASEN